MKGKNTKTALHSLIKKLKNKLSRLDTREIRLVDIDEICILTQDGEKICHNLKMDTPGMLFKLLSDIVLKITSEEIGYFTGLTFALYIYEILDESKDALLSTDHDNSLLEEKIKKINDIVSEKSDDSTDIICNSPVDSKGTDRLYSDCVIQKLSDDLEDEIYFSLITEGEDFLDDAEKNLLELEENPTDKDLIDAIFRAFHSLKGTAGFLQLDDINKLSHHAEDVLDIYRNNKQEPSEKSFNAIFKTIDTLKKLLHQLKKIMNDEKPDPVDVREANILLDDCIKNNDKIILEPKSSCNVKPPKIGEILVQEGHVTKEQIDEALKEQTRPIGEILTEKGLVSDDTIKNALKKQKNFNSPSKVEEMIKIPAKKLDELSEYIGEMVVALSLLSQKLADELGSKRVVNERIDHLEKITESLYDRILDMRMFPVENVFFKLSRQVRDLSLKQNKKVNLVIKGEDTLVDKTVIDSIYSPLMHIVRNAIDHGIEERGEREKKGKNIQSDLRLEANHLGDYIEIKVSDDGRGLQRERILEKAKSKGLIKKEEHLTDSEIFSFIFHPGFSTVENATDISGRGVGMDVVKREVDGLGGKISIESIPDKGTRFIINLPLSTSIIEGLIVRVGNIRFVLSILDVTLTVTPKTDEIKGVHGQKAEFFLLAGEMIPIIKLYRFYSIKPDVVDPLKSIIVVIKNGKKKYGLMVDELMHRQQIVIKNLGKRFSNLSGISGGTILGDGRIGFILKPQQLITERDRYLGLGNKYLGLFRAQI